MALRMLSHLVCDSRVIVMNLESYTINIWCMIGENSEFSVDSEMETERDKLDRRYLMAPSAMVYIRHWAV